MRAQKFIFLLCESESFITRKEETSFFVQLYPVEEMLTLASFFRPVSSLFILFTCLRQRVFGEKIFACNFKGFWLHTEPNLYNVRQS